MGVYRYCVDFTEVVHSKEPEVVDASEDAILMLMTCYPFAFWAPHQKDLWSEHTEFPDEAKTKPLCSATRRRESSQPETIRRFEMRYLTTFGMVALTMAFWNLGTSAAAQSVPSGSYQQTCKDIGANGATLYAKCQNTNGGWQSTQLSNFEGCTGEIVNDNGALRCGMRGNGGPYADQRRDQSDWQNNGRDDNRNANRDDDRDRNGVSNQGDRSDRDQGRDGDGTYTQTCRNVQKNGDTITANCEKKNGSWRQTSISNFRTCLSQIINDNGRLRCTR